MAAVFPAEAEASAAAAPRVVGSVLAPPFTAEDAAAISEAIARAERKTCGEIVVVAAVASDGYRSFGVLWAALLALAVPMPLIFMTKWPVEIIYLLQLLVFFICLVLFQWHKLRYALVPKAVKRARAHQRAVEQFLSQNLHTTEGRTGVLIYVSFAEHMAELIADEGIAAHVEPRVWDEAMAALIAGLRRGAPGEGLAAAVRLCGEVLAERFPVDAGPNPNELPNAVVVLPRA